MFLLWYRDLHLPWKHWYCDMVPTTQPGWTTSSMSFRVEPCQGLALGALGVVVNTICYLLFHISPLSSIIKAT